MLEVFGLPFVEALESQLINGQQLYNLINLRVSKYLKAKLSDLLIDNNNTNNNTNETINNKSLKCYKNDEIFGGNLSRTGFRLRLIIGGANHCLGCPRCQWIDRCNGCVIPDNPEFQVSQIIILLTTLRVV